MSNCPACGHSGWKVTSFVGGDTAAWEKRQCQDCGHTWSVELTKHEYYD